MFQFSIQNLSFRCGLSQKSRKNVNRKHHFVIFRSETYHSVRSYPKKVEKTSSENTTLSFFVLKPIIPLRTSPKKSKKRQAETLLLKIRSTPIALAALPADFSIFAVPPLCSNFRSKTDADFCIFSVPPCVSVPLTKTMIFESLAQIFDVLSEDN